MQDTRFNSWVEKIPWSRYWQLTLVFLPVEFHGQRSMAGYSLEVARIGHDLATKLPTTIHIYIPQKLMLSFIRYPFKKLNIPALWNCPPPSLLLSSYSYPYYLQNEYLNFLHYKLVLPWYKCCLGII